MTATFFGRAPTDDDDKDRDENSASPSVDQSAIIELEKTKKPIEGVHFSSVDSRADYNSEIKPLVIQSEQETLADRVESTLVLSHGPTGNSVVTEARQESKQKTIEDIHFKKELNDQEIEEKAMEKIAAEKEAERKQKEEDERLAAEQENLIQKQN